jgi:hypothetical protein
MALDWNAFLLEVEGIVGTVLPEVKAPDGGGIYEANQMERVSYERLPGLPYAVLETEDPEPSDRLLNVENYEKTLRIHYITHEKVGSRGAAQVRARLTRLAAYLWANDPVSFDLLDFTGYMFGVDHPANEVFITKGMPMVAGALNLSVSLSERG